MATQDMFVSDEKINGSNINNNDSKKDDNSTIANPNLFFYENKQNVLQDPDNKFEIKSTNPTSSLNETENNINTSATNTNNLLNNQDPNILDNYDDLLLDAQFDESIFEEVVPEELKKKEQIELLSLQNISTEQQKVNTQVSNVLSEATSSDVTLTNKAISDKNLNSIDELDAILSSFSEITKSANYNKKYIDKIQEPILDSPMAVDSIKDSSEPNKTDNNVNTTTETKKDIPETTETSVATSKQEELTSNITFENDIIMNEILSEVNKNSQNNFQNESVPESSNTISESDIVNAILYGSNVKIEEDTTVVSQPNTVESDNSKKRSEISSGSIDDSDKQVEKKTKIESTIDNTDHVIKTETETKPDQSISKDSMQPPPSVDENKPKKRLSKEQHKYCIAMLRSLKRHRDAGPFVKPVDIVALQILDYPNVVKEPMDLGTVESKLKSDSYNNTQEFIADMDRIFNNCYLYNGKELPVSLMAQNLEKAYRNQLKKMPEDVTEVATPAKRPSSNSSSASKARERRESHPPPSRDIPSSSIKQRVKSRQKADPQLKFCGNIIRDLFKKSYSDLAYFFYEPVDWKTLGIPEYPKVIKNPMDLGTIRDKYQNNEYKNANEFEADIRLMFRNCYAFNPPKHSVHLAGKALEDIFEKKWKDLPPFAAASPTTSHGSKSRHKHYIDDAGYDQDIDVMDSTSNNYHDYDSPKSIKIMHLERHVQEVTRQLEDLKRTEELKHIEETQKSGSRKSSSSRGRGSTSRKSSVNTTTHSALAAETNRRGRGTGRKKVSRSSRGGKNVSKDDKRSNVVYLINGELSLNQKRELSTKIEKLPAERLQVALNIIRSACPGLVDEEEEIELDIDVLSPFTLKKLYDYVVLGFDHFDESRYITAPRGSNHVSQLEEKLRAFDSEGYDHNDNVSHNNLQTHSYSSSSDSGSADSHSDDSGDRSD
ncbi:hypothetical protein BB558_005149 [Smittium angustum]|uniref:Bromo domain-containing protein n=1 Tax=Smittium angustum TaxID=133377 RepID=A0A2U1J1A9_SMIAN|nr:hypothetical protein BB558_005149 [Smittium angustum]